jgi:hypothetical protein
MVNGKKYPYTPAGKAAAAAEKKKKPDPALSYGATEQERDRQKTEAYYEGKYRPVIDKARDERSQVGNYLNAEVQDRTSDTIRDAAQKRREGIAWQNSYIAKGAMANKEALKRVAAKKKNKGEMVDYGYTKVPKGDPFDKNQRKLYEKMAAEEKARVAKLNRK